MKIIRIGNDVNINWKIWRLHNKEDFTGKNVGVRLLDKNNTPVEFSYSISYNSILGTFYGKDQTTNGKYRLELVENKGASNMATLDFVDAFTLSYTMKNKTVDGYDASSTLSSVVTDLSSTFSTAEIDPDNYYTKLEINSYLNDINTYFGTVKNECYNYSEQQGTSARTSAYNYTDAKIAEIDLSAYAKKTELPTKTSQLTNDSGFVTSAAVEGKEDKANKKTSITSASSDTDYPSAKAVYSYVGANVAALESAINDKVDKETGKGLSTNDYTTAEKTKLAGVAEGATANIGTLTGITMNGASKGTSGVVDLGTVITAHQDITGKEDTSNKVTTVSASSTNTEYPSALAVKTFVTGVFSYDTTTGYLSITV